MTKRGREKGRKNLKGNKMENSTQQLQDKVAEFLKENEKFTSGNSAAGTRARKALAELGKLVKVRRNEITEEKNARKEAKVTK